LINIALFFFQYSTGATFGWWEAVPHLVAVVHAALGGAAHHRGRGDGVFGAVVARDGLFIPILLQNPKVLVGYDAKVV
jgi:hypothetical protein